MKAKALPLLRRRMRTALIDSYGSMTYALITSYIYVQLASRTTCVSRLPRPGRPRTTSSRRIRACRSARRRGRPLLLLPSDEVVTLDLLESTEIELPDGTKVDWRADLFAAIQGNAKVLTAKTSGKKIAFWINEVRAGPRVFAPTTAYMVSLLAKVHEALPE